jgi:hypothetical protein
VCLVELWHSKKLLWALKKLLWLVGCEKSKSCLVRQPWFLGKTAVNRLDMSYVIPHNHPVHISLFFLHEDEAGGWGDGKGSSRSQRSSRSRWSSQQRCMETFVPTLYCLRTSNSHFTISQSPVFQSCANMLSTASILILLTRDAVF